MSWSLTHEKDEDVKKGVDLLLNAFNLYVRNPTAKEVEDLLEQFPDPVFANILSNLSFEQLKSITTVSKRFKRIIKNYYLIERKHPVYTFKKATLSRIPNVMNAKQISSSPRSHTGIVTTHGQ